MNAYEIDIEVRVRKTLWLSGPTNEQAVRELVESLLKPGGISISLWSLQKKENDGASFPMPRPVETIIDNDPQIVAIRRVD